MKRIVGSWWEDPDSKSKVLGDNSNPVGKVALKP
jgi:hypothetical protein